MPTTAIRRTTRRTLAAAAAAVVLPFALSACGETAEQAAEEAIEKQAEEGGNGDVEVDLDDDGVKIEGEDGSFQSGTGELPEDFPEEIEVIDGEVATASSDSGTFYVIITTDKSEDEAYDDATGLLTDDGFTQDGEELANTGAFNNDSWTVAVSVTPWEDGVAAVQYSVVPAA
jgi:hypothetical protein